MVLRSENNTAGGGGTNNMGQKKGEWVQIQKHEHVWVRIGS